MTAVVNHIETIIVPPELDGLELDEFLSLRFPRIAKGQLRKLIRTGKVSIDGAVEPNPKKLRADAVVMVEMPAEGLPQVADVPVEVSPLWENENVLFVDKPSGISVEPERWARQGATLIGALIHFAETQSSEGEKIVSYRPRVVHRLDKDTSGVVCLAKNLETERFLRNEFENRTVEKEYWALVEGEIENDNGYIDLPIGPDDRKSGKMQVPTKGGKPAQTRFEVLERFKGFTLVKAYPETGRTHQIRVHFAAKGFPLAVDTYYGNRDELFLSAIKRNYRLHQGRKEIPIMGRLTLHAKKISISIKENEKVTVEAPLPKDFSVLLDKLRRFRGKK